MVTRALSRAERESHDPIKGEQMDEKGASEHRHPAAKGRRELPAEAVAVLRAWLVSPEHFHHPYPTTQDQEELMAATGIDRKQLKNWFTNARRRIWKPLVSAGVVQVSQDDLVGGSSNDTTYFDELTLLRDPSGPDAKDDPLGEKNGAPPPRSAEEPPPVRVGSTLPCAFCQRVRVDTQLVPCKHLFHGQCLRPWLEATVTTPSCPCCAVPIAHCVLAKVN